MMSRQNVLENKTTSVETLLVCLVLEDWWDSNLYTRRNCEDARQKRVWYAKTFIDGLYKNINLKAPTHQNNEVTLNSLKKKQHASCHRAL